MAQGVGMHLYDAQDNIFLPVSSEQARIHRKIASQQYQASVDVVPGVTTVQDLVDAFVEENGSLGENNRINVYRGLPKQKNSKAKPIDKASIAEAGKDYHIRVNEAPVACSTLSDWRSKWGRNPHTQTDGTHRVCIPSHARGTISLIGATCN